MNTYFALLLTLATSVTLAAEPIPSGVLDRAKKIMPDISADQISPSPVKDLYELIVGSRVIYITADGQYMLRGDLIDMDQGQNITENSRKTARSELIASLDESKMVVFAPDDVKGTVTVFTDTTCPYCSKFHREVTKLNENGIKVRYLAYPRAGVPSSAADTLVSVWCADDQQTAMTKAKAGQDIEPKVCDNPVKQHYNIGGQLGIGGTPTLILDDGTLVGGYVPYARLVDYFHQDSTQ